jgi:hypothetical protein
MDVAGERLSIDEHEAHVLVGRVDEISIRCIQHPGRRGMVRSANNHQVGGLAHLDRPDLVEPPQRFRGIARDHLHEQPIERRFRGERQGRWLACRAQPGDEVSVGAQQTRIAQRDVGNLQLVEQRARAARRPVGSERHGDLRLQRVIHERGLSVEQQVRERRPYQFDAQAITGAVSAVARRSSHGREIVGLEPGAVHDHSHVGHQAHRREGGELLSRRNVLLRHNQCFATAE